MRCKHFYSVENDCSYMLIWTSDAVTLSTPLSQEREVDSEEWRNAEERTKESEREREFRLRFVVLHSRSVVHDPYNTNSCTCVFLQDYEDKIIHNRIHAKLVVPRTLVPRTSHGGQLVNGI